MATRMGAILALSVLAITGFNAQGQPALISTVPGNNATGVSPSAAVQFSFDLPMETSATVATFIDISNPFSPLPVTVSWNPQQTILTCTPNPAFPVNKMIFWTVTGEDITGDPLEDAQGFFTTGGGGGSTGSGTNRFTSFALGKLYTYNQTTTGVAVRDPDVPYAFTASTTLASNRTANQITLTIPSRPSTNLLQNPFAPEVWGVFAAETNQSQFETVLFPSGTYTFNVQSGTTNQNVSLSLAANLAQPAAPHLSEFAGTQAVDPAQAYTLRWDAFQNGAAGDYVRVQIGDTVGSADPGTAGALNGLARSFVIPAGRLLAGQSYESSVDFYKVGQIISNASYVAISFRVSSTRFILKTSGTTGTDLVLTNASWTGNAFGFDVISAPGETFTVEASIDLTPGSWAPVTVSTSPTGRIRITDSLASFFPHRFYRARKGSL